MAVRGQVQTRSKYHQRQLVDVPTVNTIILVEKKTNSTNKGWCFIRSVVDPDPQELP